MNITPRPTAVKVLPHAEFPKVMVVEFYWNADLDRPHSYGIACNDRNVTRLVRAFFSGKLFPNPRVVNDMHGQSYIAHDFTVHGKTISKDLTKLGF